jgi:hypothetical protein
MDDPLDEDKIRHTPPWRSQLATLLVNRVDSAYKELRRSEYPKRSGRKPSKRIAPSNPVVSDSTCWPIELPDDCYSQSWLKELEPQHKITLKAREPILGGLSIWKTCCVNFSFAHQFTASWLYYQYFHSV